MLQKVPNSLVSFAQSTTQGSLFLWLPDIINCLMEHSSSDKWISYNFFYLTDINMLQSRSICFHTGLKPSFADRLLPLSVANVLLKQIIPTQGTLLELHRDQGSHFTGQVLLQVCTVSPVLQHFHCTYHPQSSGLVEHANGIVIKQK